MAALMVTQIDQCSVSSKTLAILNNYNDRVHIIKQHHFEKNLFKCEGFIYQGRHHRCKFLFQKSEFSASSCHRQNYLLPAAAVVTSGEAKIKDCLLNCVFNRCAKSSDKSLNLLKTLMQTFTYPRAKVSVSPGHFIMMDETYFSLKVTNSLQQIVQSLVV